MSLLRTLSSAHAHCYCSPIEWDTVAAQTQQGARSSANPYSLVSCARVNGLEPYAYLRYLFEELPKASTAEALEALLPWNVKTVLQARQRAAAA